MNEVHNDTIADSAVVNMSSAERRPTTGESQKGGFALKRILLIALAVIAAATFSAAFAGHASAANHPGDANGLPKHNHKAAFVEVMNRADSDDALGRLVAHETGAKEFNRSDYSDGGYTKAGPGTNTAWDENGNIVPARSTANCHTGAQVLMVINLKTFKGLEMCTGCENPHIRQIILHLPKRPWQLTSVMRFKKHVLRVYTKTCPNGTPVRVPVDTWAIGVVRAKTWGQLQGKMTAKLEQQVTVVITQKVQIQCGEAPQPPPPTKVKTAPITLEKSCVTGNEDRIGCPSGTFTFVINGSAFVYNPQPGHIEMAAGECTVGQPVPGQEVNIPDGWKIAPGTSAVQPPQMCVEGGVRFSFKNMEVKPPVIVPPTTYTATCAFAGVSGRTLSFVASGSASNGAAPTGANWTFNDGGTASGLNTSRTFAAYATTYSVTTLTVTFSDGHVQAASVAGCTGTTGPPPVVTRSIQCITNHDVFSGGQIDLVVKVTNSDGTQPLLAPSDIQIWVDEGVMLGGTLHTYTDNSGVYWGQMWAAPTTTRDHPVIWHATATGVSTPCTGSNTVRTGY